MDGDFVDTVSGHRLFQLIDMLLFGLILLDLLNVLSKASLQTFIKSQSCRMLQQRHTTAPVLSGISVVDHAATNCRSYEIECCLPQVMFFPQERPNACEQNPAIAENRCRQLIRLFG